MKEFFRKNHLILWTPVVVIYGVITIASSVSPTKDTPRFFLFLGSIDKITHFLEYAILGLVIARAISWENYYHGIRRFWWIVALVALSLAALIDEVHQYFVPRRVMELGDFLVDIAGGIFGMLAYVLIRHRPRFKKASSVSGN